MSRHFMSGFADELLKHAAVDPSQGTMYKRPPKAGGAAPGSVTGGPVRPTKMPAPPKHGVPAAPKPGVNAPMNPYAGKAAPKQKAFTPRATARSLPGNAMAGRGKFNLGASAKLKAPPSLSQMKAGPAKAKKPAGERTTKWQRHLRKAKAEGGAKGLATARGGKDAFLKANKGAQRYSKPGAPAPKSVAGAKPGVKAQAAGAGAAPPKAVAAKPARPNSSPEQYSSPASDARLKEMAAEAPKPVSKPATTKPAVAKTPAPTSDQPAKKPKRQYTNLPSTSETRAKDEKRWAAEDKAKYMDNYKYTGTIPSTSNSRHADRQKYEKAFKAT